MNGFSQEECKRRFDALCLRAVSEARQNGLEGFGTLAEKRLHAVIKNYICEDHDYHEVGLSGTRYVSDVRIGRNVYEVQTGHFYPMAKKIGYYLSATDCRVTVVHPVSQKRWVTWLDPVTYRVLERNRAVKKGHPAELLAEMYSLLPYLGNPRLRFCLLLLETEDFRLLNGAKKNPKKGGDRYDRVPLALYEELLFQTPDDFRTLLPETLKSPFTVKDFSKATGVRGIDAYSAVKTLLALGLVEKSDPIGRAQGYAILPKK